MDKDSFPSFVERLFHRTGRWYPILILLLMQLVNTPLLIMLTAIPAQENAEFSLAQGTSLLIFGSIALLFRNAILLLQYYGFNRDLINRLSRLGKPEAVDTDPKQEKRAWEQANISAIGYNFFEFVGFYILVLIPTMAYGFVNLYLSIQQLVQLSLAAAAASLVNYIVGNLILDQWFKPVKLALIPKKFETQLTGFKGVRIWVKLSGAILGVVIISLLLTIPTAYHQLTHIAEDASSPQQVKNAVLAIVKSGIGAIVVATFLSFQLASYFSVPFRKMIDLFKVVETGDFSQRIEVFYSDEFGKLNIFLNHMIERLQILTYTLEQQVVDRTAQLSQANNQLLFEIKEHKRMEEQLAYVALHDSLTNLANRVLFMNRLQHAMERAKRHKNITFAVIFLDLDGFKIVNDSLGHNFGDLLLIESARRLIACVRSEDLVARLGGDEFVILIEEMEDSAEAIRIARRILNDLGMPADLDGQLVFVSASIGIVFNDARYELPEDILRDADISMYHAKRQGRGRYSIFTTEMLDGVMTRVLLEADLRKALENQEFVVYYQSIIDLSTHQIVGFEALLRWQHPTQGLILPAAFISTAEEIGLIVPIGYWVLDEACRQIRNWQEQYPHDPPLTVNVNISMKQCVEIDFVEKVVEILENYKLDASSLKLEIMESLILENSEYISTILLKLDEMGIKVQIDDFGTGYLLLDYLHTLPIDTLKINRAFISRLGNNDKGSEIVQTILTMAHGFGMKVVAEGVETNEQLFKLKLMDCEYVQGFLLAKPESNQEVGKLLRNPFVGNEDRINEP